MLRLFSRTTEMKFSSSGKVSLLNVAFWLALPVLLLGSCHREPQSKPIMAPAPTSNAQCTYGRGCVGTGVAPSLSPVGLLRSLSLSARATLTGPGRDTLNVRLTVHNPGKDTIRSAVYNYCPVHALAFSRPGVRYQHPSYGQPGSGPPPLWDTRRLAQCEFVASAFELAPGASRTFSRDWPIRRLLGDSLRGGTYHITAYTELHSGSRVKRAETKYVPAGAVTVSR